MFKSKVLVFIIGMLYILFAIFEFSGYDAISYRLDCLVIPVITLLYMTSVDNKNRYFILFLLFYSLSDILALVVDVMSNGGKNVFTEFQYFIGNSLYILAYFFLFLKIIGTLCFKHVFRNFKIHIAVLLALNIYLIYVLQIIVKPNLVMDIDYYLELVYNVITFLLLSAALLNYFYRDNKKSLYLFIGTLCIVFSEVIDIAYIYITQRSLLSVIASTLSLVAFYFFYQQSTLLDEENNEERYTTIEEN